MLQAFLVRHLRSPRRLVTWLGLVHTWSAQIERLFLARRGRWLPPPLEHIKLTLSFWSSTAQPSLAGWMAGSRWLPCV